MRSPRSEELLAVGLMVCVALFIILFAAIAWAMTDQAKCKRIGQEFGTRSAWSVAKGCRVQRAGDGVWVPANGRRSG